MTTNTIPLNLGTDALPKLLRRYAMPAIIGMLASSLYNLVDSICIGQGLGPMALAAMGITFPMSNICAAFGTLVGVGASSLMAIRFGEKDYDSARLILGNVLILNVVIGILVMAVALLFLDPILYFFGASDNTIDMAREYMTIILIGNTITHLYFGLNSILRSSGHPQLAMYATIVSVSLNIIMDVLFIFVFGWGIKGAAWATIIAQIVAFIWQISVFFRKNEFLRIEAGIFHLDWKIIGDIFAIGMAPFLMNIASCAVVIIFNKQLMYYGGDLAIGAYSIIHRVTFMFCIFVMGLNQGMQPIAGYNFGAKNYERVTGIFRLTAWWATGVTTLCGLCCMAIPSLLIKLFTSDADMLAMTVPAMRLQGWSFPIVGFQMVAGNFFQSIGMAKKAIFLSLTRQVLYLIPLVLLMPLWLGLDGIWWSMPISDVLSGVTAVAMLTYQFKKFKRQ